MIDYQANYELLLRIIKRKAEQPNCYNLNPNFDECECNTMTEAFDEGATWGEIGFARILLDQIGVDYEMPWFESN